MGQGENMEQQILEYLADGQPRSFKEIVEGTAYGAPIDKRNILASMCRAGKVEKVRNSDGSLQKPPMYRKA